MFLNTEEFLLLLLHLKKCCSSLVWCFGCILFVCFGGCYLFGFLFLSVFPFENLDVVIFRSLSLSLAHFLKAKFEDVCTLSKKPAGLPQIVPVLFMTAK